MPPRKRSKPVEKKAEPLVVKKEEAWIMHGHEGMHRMLTSQIESDNMWRALSTPYSKAKGILPPKVEGLPKGAIAGKAWAKPAERPPRTKVKDPYRNLSLTQLKARRGAVEERIKGIEGMLMPREMDRGIRTAAVSDLMWELEGLTQEIAQREEKLRKVKRRK